MLEKVSKLDNLGVPMTRIISDLELDISRPHLRRLITYNRAAGESKVVFASIYPRWINFSQEQAQVQPDGWTYSGVFPFGEWLNEKH